MLLTVWTAPENVIGAASVMRMSGHVVPMGYAAHLDATVRRIARMLKGEAQGVVEVC